MMFKLAIATLFLVASFTANVNAAASTNRAYFVANSAQSLVANGQSSFKPAQSQPRPQESTSASTVGQAIRYDLPVTSFNCADKPYIPGFYADVEANCEVFHVCTPEFRYSFACGENSAFNQSTLTCDHVANVSCSQTAKFYAATAGIGIETGLETPTVRKTSFTCDGKPFNPGYYADEESGCSLYHVCTGDRQFDLSCGEGTVFNQKTLSCDYPTLVDCASSSKHWDVNFGIGVALGESN